MIITSELRQSWDGLAETAVFICVQTVVTVALYNKTLGRFVSLFFRSCCKWFALVFTRRERNSLHSSRHHVPSGKIQLAGVKQDLRHSGNTKSSQSSPSGSSSST